MRRDVVAVVFIVAFVTSCEMIKKKSLDNLVRLSKKDLYIFLYNREKTCRMQTIGAVAKLLSLCGVDTGRKMPSSLQKLLPFLQKHPDIITLYTFESEIYLSYHLRKVNKVYPGDFTALERALKHLRPYRIMVVQNTHGIEAWKIIKFVPWEIAQGEQNDRKEDSIAKEKAAKKRLLAKRKPDEKFVPHGTIEQAVIEPRMIHHRAARDNYDQKRAKTEDSLEFSLSDDGMVFPESSLVFAPALPWPPESCGRLG